jgi:hypothetical protein
LRRKLVLAADEIPDQAGETLALGVIVPLQIEDREYAGAVHPKTRANEPVRKRPGQTGMRAMRLPGFHHRSHPLWLFGMPNHRIPVRCHEYSPAARPENAERLGKNAIDVGYVLRDLGADNDVERSIGLRDLRRISDGV